MPQENNDIASRLVVVEEVKPGAVWHLRDPVTGKDYFGKIATPSEVESTQRAAAMPMPEGSPVEVVGVLASGPDAIPPALEGKPEFASSHNPQHTQFLIVEAAPQGATLGQLVIERTHQDALNGSLRGKPITADEYRSIIETVKQMNENGVRHHDLMSNTEIFRDADGKLKVHIYDFEPDTFEPLYKGNMEDVSQVVNAMNKMSEYGTLEAGAKEQLLTEYEMPERIVRPSDSMAEQVQQRPPVPIRAEPPAPPRQPATSEQIAAAQKHIAQYQWEQAATRSDSIARISIEGMPPEESVRIEESLRTLGLDPKRAQSSTKGETIRITGIQEIIKLEDHVFDGKVALQAPVTETAPPSQPATTPPVQETAAAPLAQEAVAATPKPEAEALPHSKQVNTPEAKPPTVPTSGTTPHEPEQLTTKAPTTPLPAGAVKAGVSVRGMGTALALYNIVHGSENREADKKAGGAQKAFSDGALVLNAANIVLDVTEGGLALSRVAQGTLSVSRKVPVVGAVLAIGAGALEVGAANEAGDGFRKAEVVGATTGGIIGAISAGAAAGAVLGSPAFGVGAIPGAIIGGVVGLAGGLFGAWVGGYAGKELLGDDWQASLDKEGQKVREKNIAELGRIKGKFEHNSSLVKAYGEAHQAYSEHPEDPKAQKAFEDATRAMQGLKPMNEEEKKSLASLEQALAKDYQKLAALKLPEGHPEAAARREEGGRKLEESLKVIQAIKGMDDIVPTMKKESEAVIKDTSQQKAQIQAQAMVRPIEGVAYAPQAEEPPKPTLVAAMMPQVEAGRAV